MHKVLMVDDEAVILEIFQEMLSDEFHVDVCNSPNNALEMIKANQYDVVITDYNMKELDGISLSQLINKTTSVKIILVTGNVDIFSISEYPQIFALIRKPCSMREVKRVIRLAINSQ